MPFGVPQLRIKWDDANWTDETSNLKRVAFSRGRDSQLGNAQAGECTLWLKDLTGRFNPANAASPLYGDLLPLREVSLQLTYNAVNYDLFTGFVRSIEANPDRLAQEATVECVDLFLRLGRIRPVIGSQATTTGGAIQLIIDALARPVSPAPDLDDGDTITFSADGTKTGLQLIGELLTAERGFFFVAGDGAATFRERHYQYAPPYSTSQSTVADTMSALLSVVDLETIKNRATVTKTGGVEQTYTDATSAGDFDYADYSPITTPYLADDNAALSLATYLVLQAKDGTPPLRNLKLNSGRAATYVALLARELGDHITVSDTLGGTSGAYHLMRMAHEFDASARVHRCAWGLVQREGAQFFIIGTSTIGGTDIFTY